MFFDIGGVLQENKRAVQDDLISTLGISGEKFTSFWHDVTSLLGRENIGEAKFWPQMSEKYGFRAVNPEENLLGREHRAHYVKVEAVYDVVRWLKAKGVKVAVLSNTIDAHDKVFRELGEPELFQKLFLSYEMGLRKPDERIYREAIVGLGVKPEEAVFVDDDPKNVAAAKAIGMTGIMMGTAANLKADLERLVGDVVH